LIVVVGRSAPTTIGADEFEADIAEHRENDEERREFAGITDKLVDEHKKSEIERKPRVVMDHHVVFAQATFASYESQATSNRSGRQGHLR